MGLAVAESGSLLGFMAPRPGDTRVVTHQIGVKLPTFTFQPDVTGFAATATAERQVVAGLPEGVNIGGELLAVIAAAKRLEVWIEKGRRVQAWAEQNGLGEACWVDEDSGALTAPDGAPSLPAFASEWISEAPEIGAIVEGLGR